MSVLCIVPARSGSKRLPGKNWEKVGGKTLVERAVECALRVRSWVRECNALYRDMSVVIVTDAPERCNGLGVDVLEEHPDLAQDDATMDQVINWTIDQLDTEFAMYPIVLLQPTSPLRFTDDVIGCLQMFNHGADFNSVVSVVGVRENGHTRYEHNGAVYVGEGSAASTGCFVRGKLGMYVMPPERSIDINTAEDLAEARRLAGG